MSFAGLFRKTDTEVVVLIDISSDSVGGAYVALSKDALPALQYATRIPISPTRTHQPVLSKLESVLQEVLKSLVEKGAPATRDAIGNAIVSRILVSVAPPWQETLIRTDHIEEKDGSDFTFTHTKMQETMRHSDSVSENRVLTEEVVAAILLNGYETPEPFGKRAKHADLVVLSSHIESETEKSIRGMISGAFHMHEIRLASFVSIAHTVLRDVFPHEQDSLMLAISGEAADLIRVKKNIPQDIVSVPVHLDTLADDKHLDMSDATLSSSAHGKRIQNAKDRWLAGIQEALHSIHRRSPLPHTIFLIADSAYRDFAKELLDAPALRALWLSDTPLSVLPVSPANLEPFIRVQGETETDLFLEMLALYAKKLGE